MENALKRLEDWMARHKSHSCEISRDDGYGATCWRVFLWGKDRKKVEAYEAQFINGVYADYVVFVDWNLHNDDWPGLEATIHTAIDHAEKLEL